LTIGAHSLKYARMNAPVQSPSDPVGLPTGGAPENRSLGQRLALLKDKNFLTYWISGNISWFGDLFAMIAMPLLIINMTDNDASALGTVMAVSGIPRVVLSLAVVAMLGMVEMWMVYVVATVGGTVGAFLFPAQMTLMPSVLEEDDLPSGNALNTTAQQALQSFAPMVVGFLIAFLSGYDIMAAEGHQGDPAQELVAYGYAFLINAGTFVISAFMLSRVVVRPSEPVEQHEDMLSSILTGFQAVWQDAPLRAFIIYIALSQLFMMGNIMVGQPMMATLRVDMYDLPAAAIVGLFGACSGVGAVIGSLVAGFFARPSDAFYGPMMMLIAAFRGATMLALGYFTDLISVLVLYGCFGLFMGYTSVFFMTWMQTRVDISLLGRMMSVMMFAMMGVAPISAAMWGWGIDAGGLESLYYISGIVMMMVAIGGMLSPSIRLMGYSPAYARHVRHERLAAKGKIKHPG